MFFSSGEANSIISTLRNAPVVEKTEGIMISSSLYLAVVFVNFILQTLVI